MRAVVANEGTGCGGREEAVLSDADRERAERLRDWLMEHAYGAKQGLNVSALADAIGVSERKVRTFVTDLRGRGWATCGTPQTGYFWPATRDEPEATLTFLNARIRSTLTVRDGIMDGLNVIFGEDEERAQLELAP